MITRIAEIEEIAEKLETLIKSLTRERDDARAEVARLKKTLDDRELELLQTDEELQKVAEERDTAIHDREDTERRLDDVADRIKELLPLLAEDDEEAESAQDERDESF